ncbi:hypothetical protein PhCBS80983_g04811 [Powellomyces hirtus]|uniref:AAA+ ATPase domain-containing protein n=1 Tax=Powellomyces hirtus TaxID=109895 RepID=A0A507DWI5_9FUNG|nr:hypothetical protein PhCBS80983_g04811 [Powellomyces hirtus]
MDDKNRDRLRRFQRYYFAATARQAASDNKQNSPGDGDATSTKKTLSVADAYRGALLVVNEELNELNGKLSIPTPSISPPETTSAGSKDKAPPAANAVPVAQKEKLSKEDIKKWTNTEPLLSLRQRANTNKLLEVTLESYHEAMKAEFDPINENSIAARVNAILDQRRGGAPAAGGKHVLFRDGAPITGKLKIPSKLNLPQRPLPENYKLARFYKPINGNGLVGSKPAPPANPRYKPLDPIPVPRSAPVAPVTSHVAPMATVLKKVTCEKATQTLAKYPPRQPTVTSIASCTNCKRGGRAAAEKPKRRAVETDGEEENERPQRRQKRNVEANPNPFMTGNELMRSNAKEKRSNEDDDDDSDGAEYAPINGARGKKFVSPLNTRDACVSGFVGGSTGKSVGGQSKVTDERLKNIPPQMVETIMNEMLDNVAQVTWDDIVGLALAKATIKETVVFPMLRPDIFQGLRAPAKGEVFGPRAYFCMGHQVCEYWLYSFDFGGFLYLVLNLQACCDGEKLVRALFAVARVYQPSVIFVDEIDSLLSKRNDGEHDATRRIKTEFLVQFDGCATDAQDRILMIGATNRPQEIDEAVRRRFRKKLYVPLPEAQARTQMIRNRMASLAHSLTDHDLDVIVGKTDGYSGSDMDGLVREASLGPIRAIDDIQNVNVSDIRPVVLDDFIDALTQVRASVSRGDLDMYTTFDREFGSVARPTPP